MWACEAERVLVLCPHITPEDRGAMNLCKPRCGVLSHLPLPPVGAQVDVCLAESQGAPRENTDAQGRTEKSSKELEERHPESLRGPAVLHCLAEVHAPIPGAGCGAPLLVLTSKSRSTVCSSPGPDSWPRQQSCRGRRSHIAVTRFVI